MTRKRRFVAVGAGGGMGVVAVFVATMVFACTTFQGKLCIATAGGTSIAQGDNNCTMTCGDAPGSMMYCGGVQFGAVYNDATIATAVVTMAVTDNCSGAQNRLNTGTQYGINLRKTNAMTDASGGTTIGDAEDCMDWTVGNGTIHIVTVTPDAFGTFSTIISLPTGTFSNTNGWSSGLCVDDHLDFYGNESPIKVI